VKAVVFPVAIYAFETWKMRNRISAFECWCWRRLLGISWTEKRTIVSIEEQIRSAVSPENMVMKLKLSYFRHVGANGLEKSIMLGIGKRGKGKPRIRWLDEAQTIMGSTFYSLMNEAVS